MISPTFQDLHLHSGFSTKATAIPASLSDSSFNAAEQSHARGPEFLEAQEKERRVIATTGIMQVDVRDRLRRAFLGRPPTCGARTPSESKSVLVGDMLAQET